MTKAETATKAAAETLAATTNVDIYTVSDVTYAAGIAAGMTMQEAMKFSTKACDAFSDAITPSGPRYV